MDYKTIAEGKRARGLRLVLSMGMPGPWGEAAKGIFHVKGLSYMPVGQVIGSTDPELVTWTGVRNAPVAAYEDEKPIDRWIDILMLAERLKPTPPLLPESSDERALAIGIANEICGEWGFGWCRRVMLVAHSATLPNPNPASAKVKVEYRCDDEATVRAPKRVADILRMLVKRLKDQKAKGSDYFFGPGITAVDIYWAAFSALLQPMPKELNPMPPGMHELYGAGSPETEAARDPILIAHRDMIYKKHLVLPLDF